MPRPLSEQVVVITGASSGIGRETALRFAGQGARVVLVARNQDALVDVSSHTRRLAGEALPAPADVSDWTQVQQVAQRAVDAFGRIDTWVNNAGVAVYGTFADTTPAEFKRVVDVNLMGQVYGAKAALPHLQRTHGTLIGITSSVGRLPVPLLSAYGAAKNGLTAFYNTLRLEQEREQSGVQISVVVPAGVDTPFFDHAQTHLGVKPGPGGVSYAPELVADAILYVAEHPTRQMIVGAGVAAGFALERAAPRLVERVLQRMAYAAQRTRQPKAPDAPSNLWHPLPELGASRGGFHGLGFDPYAWLEMRPQLKNIAAGLALAALAVPLAGLLARASACPWDESIS